MEKGTGGRRHDTAGRLSRRGMLRFAGTLAGTAILAACGASEGAPTNTPAAGVGSTATPVPVIGAGNAAVTSTPLPAAPTSGSTGVAMTAASANPSAAPSVPAVARLDKAVSLEIMTTPRDRTVAVPGADWFWPKAVKEALNIDVTVTFVTPSDQFPGKLNTRAGANDLPDLFSPDLTQTSQLAAQGLLADWSPYLKAMPTFVQAHKVNDLASIGTFDGKLNGLVTANQFPWKGIDIMRKDWADKLGLMTPKSLDDYLNMMKAFTERDPDGNGRKDTFGWSGYLDAQGRLSGFDPIFGAFDALGDWKIADGKLVSVLTTPERLEGLKFINGMNAAGVLDPDWKSQQFEDYRRKWKAGKVGLSQEDWNGTFSATSYRDFANANGTGDLVIIPPPVGAKGTSAVTTYSNLGMIVGLSKRAADAGKGEVAARLLEWMAGPGYYATAYGREGVNWKLENGRVVPGPQAFTDIMYAPVTQLAVWAYNSMPDELRTRYDVVTMHPNGKTISLWEEVQQGLKLPYVDTTAFSILPPMPAERVADLRRTIAEGELGFATGQRPFSQWDAYVKSLDGAGLGDWTAQATKRAKEGGLIK